MDKTYQGFKMIRTEKLSSRYGFSATDKKIRVHADLFDLDNDIIFEEAILVRDIYCREVQKAKDLGQKPKPQSIKTIAYAEAEQVMLGKYGSTYTNLIGGKVVKEVKPRNKKPVEEKQLNTELVQEVSNQFEDDYSALMEEFDSNVSEPIVKIKPVDLSNLDILPTTDTYKPKKEMVEDSMEEVAVDNLDIFDVELDISDIFEF